MRHTAILSLSTLFVSAALLTGCGVDVVSTSSSPTHLALQGSVFGGSQPIKGSHVYLYAANTTGYGGNGIAASTANASISLLTANTNTSVDPNGNYFVTTATDGSFSISGDYNACPAGSTTQVYLYATGGNAGAGNNSAIGLLAALGPCTSLGTATKVILNEATTIAAAYSLAAFATDATHVSSSGTALAQVGLANAFLSAGNITTLSTGAPRATPAAGNGTVPQQEINSLADILASCVDSNGAITGPTNPSDCYTLFYNARSAGTSGTTPSDTATAALNIAHYPAAAVTALYGLQSSTGAPFAPTLTAQPSDFTVAIQFTGGTLNEVGFIAVDALGNIWVPNTTTSNVSNVVELSPTGAVLSPSTGYLNVVTQPDGIAIDTAGYIWVTNDTAASSTLSKLNPNGTAAANSPFGGGGLNDPRSIAFDGSGDVFAAGGTKISEFSGSPGAPLSSTGYATGTTINLSEMAVDPAGKVWYSGYEDNVNYIYSLSISGSTGTNAAFPVTGGDGPVAIDAAGNIWVAGGNGSTSKLSNTGSPVIGSPFSGGGQCESCANSIAIDGAGNVWIANGPFEGQAPINITELNNSGAVLSPSTGFQSALLTYPLGIAVDGSGNVWVGDNGGPDVVEFVGAATPVITPIAAGLPATPTTDGSSNLGTRP